MKSKEQIYRPVQGGGYIETGLKMFGPSRIYAMYLIATSIYSDLLFFFFFFLLTLSFFPYLNVYKPLVLASLSPYVQKIGGLLGKAEDEDEGVEIMKEEL